MMDTRGILEGATWFERAKELDAKWNIPKYQNKLEQLLRDLIEVSRNNFIGKLSYAAGSWEFMMPWDDLDLDILGDNHYWYPDYGNIDDPTNGYYKHMQQYKKFKKPYYITEYGSGTFTGAFSEGGAAWEKSAYLPYDEDEQAEAIDWYFSVFNKVGVDGCFLYEFVDNEPTVSQKEFGIMFVTQSGFLKRKKGAHMIKSYKRTSS